LIVGMGIRQVSHCQAQPGVPKTRGIGSSDHIKQAPAESCGQHGRKSTKSIANQPSRVVKSSTSRRSRSSRSTKQQSRSLCSTQSTTGSSCHVFIVSISIAWQSACSIWPVVHVNARNTCSPLHIPAACLLLLFLKQYFMW